MQVSARRVRFSILLSWRFAPHELELLKGTLFWDPYLRYQPGDPKLKHCLVDASLCVCNGCIEASLASVMFLKVSFTLLVSGHVSPRRWRHGWESHCFRYQLLADFLSVVELRAIKHHWVPWLLRRFPPFFQCCAGCFF